MLQGNVVTIALIHKKGKIMKRLNVIKILLIYFGLISIFQEINGSSVNTLKRVSDVLKKLVQSSRSQPTFQPKEGEWITHEAFAAKGWLPSKEDLAKKGQLNSFRTNTDRTDSSSVFPKGQPEIPKQAKQNATPCSIKVKKLEVLQQVEHPWPDGNIEGSDLAWMALEAGEGGNCGYHALKNVVEFLKIWKRFGKLPTLESQNELNNFAVYKQFMEENALKIYVKYHGEGLTWLDGEKLEYLKKELEPKNPLINSILIIENVPVEGLEFNEDVLLAVRNFVSQPNQILGIIWNKGVRLRLENFGGAHWVGFVAVKTNNFLGQCDIELFVMDSLGYLSDSPEINDVQALLSLTPSAIDNTIKLNNQKRQEADSFNKEKTKNYLRIGNSDPNVFTEFVGCFEIKNQSIPKQFGLELEKILNDDIALINSVNKNWSLYYYPEINEGVKNSVKNRIYGVWINPFKKTACILPGEDFGNCENMARVCQKDWLALEPIPNSNNRKNVRRIPL